LHRLRVETAGVESEPHLAPEGPGDLRHSVIDCSRAARELRWHAEVTLAAGPVTTWGALD